LGETGSIYKIRYKK